MTAELDTRPTPLGVGLAGLFAAGVPIATAAVALSLVPSLLGVLFIVVGTARGRKSIPTLGVGALLLGVLTAGLGGARPEVLLLGTTCLVLAWDASLQAIDLGRTLGRAADTTRALTAHTVISTIAAAVIVGLGYGLFRIPGDGYPVTVLALLLFGALVLGAAFRG